SMTPTPTPVPGESMTCAPRPPVGVSTARIASGLVQVTITASTSSGTPNNTLQELRFGTAQNAVIEVNGQSRGAGNSSVALVPGTRQTVFVIRRLNLGAVIVPLSVIDGCGEWRTFVGGG